MDAVKQLQAEGDSRNETGLDQGSWGSPRVEPWLRLWVCGERRTLKGLALGGRQYQAARSNTDDVLPAGTHGLPWVPPKRNPRELSAPETANAVSWRKQLSVVDATGVPGPHRHRCCAMVQGRAGAGTSGTDTICSGKTAAAHQSFWAGEKRECSGGWQPHRCYRLKNVGRPVVE